ncbi:FUSC family protein [Conexibacter sp. CPCC 206217]|uniref:FUSC family protein n=1 Tax=Conexibacter sp. CPCC 206217 TaxID=3064574 RepID=UPI002720F11A|nr:FUSC family protein [Conexibacter sp. CPCC 206217]MDO8211935.1 FUSC family protein [Conexibacter sp. CPCC 206217]
MSEATGTLWSDAFRVERAGIDPLAGLAGAIATCGPLALGVAFNEPAIGVAGCFGGLNAALGVPRGPLRERLGWGIAAALLCTLSVTIATAVQDSAVASAVAVLVIVALATALRSLGPDGGLTGFVIGAIFTITNGIPAAPLSIGERSMWFLAASAVGVALMVLAYSGDHPLNRSATAPALSDVLRTGAGKLRDTFAHDAVLRAHALRLATVVAVTTLGYKLLDLEHGYWIPLTILAVLQPDEHASRVRALQRAAGTLVGTIGIALLTISTGSQWLMVAAQGLCAFGLFALFARGYFWLVVLLTPTALLTISAVDYQGADIALERALTSGAGILIGLAIGELVWRVAPQLPSGARPWHDDGRST